MSDFDAFWAKYPKRVARLDAMKAWAKMQPPIDDVLAALVWQCEQWDDMQYVPYPASWIRAGRWLDERPAAKVEKADMYGHIPPCRDWQVCRDRVLAEARAARAEGRELRLVNGE